MPFLRAIFLHDRVKLAPVHFVAIRIVLGNPDHRAFGYFESSDFLTVSLDVELDIRVAQLSLRQGKLDVVFHSPIPYWYDIPCGDSRSGCRIFSSLRQPNKSLLLFEM